MTKVAETRQVDPNTGGEKGSKDAVIGDACPKALLELAKVYGMGRKKYARLNYLKGYDWSLSYDALQRHAMLFWAGEEKDGERRKAELVAGGATPEDALAQILEEGHSDLHHMAHAAWHCLGLLAFVLRKIGTDDRP